MRLTQEAIDQREAAVMAVAPDLFRPFSRWEVTSEVWYRLTRRLAQAEAAPTKPAAKNVVGAVLSAVASLYLAIHLLVWWVK